MNLFHFIHSTLEGCLLAKQLLYVAQFSESLVSISSHDSHWDIKVSQVGTFLGNLYLCYKNRQEGSLPTLFLPLSKIKWDAWSCSSYLVTMKIKSQGANDGQVEEQKVGSSMVSERSLSNIRNCLHTVCYPKNTPFCESLVVVGVGWVACHLYIKTYDTFTNIQYFCHFSKLCFLRAYIRIGGNKY